MSFQFSLWYVVCLIGGGLCAAASGAAESGLLLAQSGEAKVKITLAETASPESIRIAGEFSQALQRITGASFETVTARQPTGIVVGTDLEWPGVLPPLEPGRPDTLGRDDYVIMTHEGVLYLVGRTAHGLDNAQWDFLHRTGFRQFFPGPRWEIWPTVSELRVSLNVYETPSFYTRRLFMAGRSEVQRRTLYAEWEKRNRMASGFRLETQHAWGAIIARNRDFFETHPETIVRPGKEEQAGRPGDEKFDPDAEALLPLLVEDSLDRLARGGDSVSMDPSDGGGWKKDSPLGSPTNQVIYLANHVAHAIQAQYPGRKVGIYAYNEHSPAPDIKVDPNVVVSVATQFIRGGYTVRQLLADWRASGAAEMGIREYMSVWSWEREWPGRSLASRVDQLAEDLQDYHNWGVRYWISEASYAWGAHGIGYYLASRILWDIEQVGRIQEILDDFYLKSFGEAAPWMKSFYENYILERGNPLVSEDLIGRMYRTLLEALEQQITEEQESRILDLVAYTRCIELMFHYQNQSGDQRQQAWKELVDFSRGIDYTLMVNVRAIQHSLPSRDRQLQAVENWGEPSEVTESELRMILQLGVERNQVHSFQTKAYSSRSLVPLQSEEDTQGGLHAAIRGDSRLYLYGEPDEPFVLKLKGGEIYDNRGPIYLRLFADAHVIPGEPVDEQEVEADKEWHQIELNSPYGGLHTLEVADGNNLTRIALIGKGNLVLPVSPEEKTRFHGRYSGWFYVPAEVKVVAGYTSHPSGRIKDASGNVLYDLGSLSEAGHFIVEVPEDQNGALWHIENVTGEILLLTVPAFLALEPGQILVPKETFNLHEQ